MIDRRACRVRIEIFDDCPDFGHLITYEPDFNDPPPELLPEVKEYLHAHSERYATDYNPAIGINVHCRDWQDAVEFVEKFKKPKD